METLKTLSAKQEEIRRYLEEYNIIKGDRLAWKNRWDFAVFVMLDKYRWTSGINGEKCKEASSIVRMIRKLYHTNKELFYDKETGKAEQEWIDWSRAKQLTIKNEAHKKLH